MAGLDPAIHVFIPTDDKDADARHKAGHDEANRKPHAHPQSPAHPRRRDRPRSDGRGEEAHRLDERPRHGHVRDRGRAVRRLRVRRAWRRDHRRDGREGEGRGCGDLRFGRRAEVGQGAVRASPGSGAAAAAQGPAALRQPAPRRDLSGARGCLVAQARAGRGARHHDPARADRRRVFRRAEDDHGSRQRPEARHRYADLRHLRDRAHRARGVRAGAQAAQQGHLDGEAQRHEDGRAVERGRHADARARVQGRAARACAWPTPAACSSCATRSSST